MPSYGGAPIFGFAVTMATGDYELRRQENEFPGISGVESLTLGASGLFTEVDGTLAGSGSAGLAAAEGTFRSYKDGVARVLVDNYGESWGNVVLDTFQPQGRVKQDPGGNFFRSYKSRFRHLTSQ
jgi:hypothetical protein